MWQYLSKRFWPNEDGFISRLHLEYLLLFLLMVGIASGATILISSEMGYSWESWARWLSPESGNLNAPPV